MFTCLLNVSVKHLTRANHQHDLISPERQRQFQMLRPLTPPRRVFAAPYQSSASALVITDRTDAAAAANKTFDPHWGKSDTKQPFLPFIRIYNNHFPLINPTRKTTLQHSAKIFRSNTSWLSLIREFSSLGVKWPQLPLLMFNSQHFVRYLITFSLAMKFLPGHSLTLLLRA